MRKIILILLGALAFQSCDYNSKYIRGPRGGCYYNNSNGNKTYVDRGYCATNKPFTEIDGVIYYNEDLID